MPYVFPYENLFVGLICLVIIGLVFFRWHVGKRQKKP
jgi:hypothetical protein